MQTFNTIALIRAIFDRRGFVLVQGKLEERPNQREYNVFVSRETRCAVLPEERKMFEDPRENLWRVGAGGGLMILHCADCSIALMRYRDRGAPSYGDHWTLGAGLTTSVEEIVHPIRVVVRECVEEFIILTPHGIAIPTFGDNVLDAAARGAVRSSTFVRHMPIPPGFNTNRYQTVEASFRNVAEESTLTITFDGAGDVSVSGIVVIDPNTRGIDLLKVVDVNLPYALDEIAVMDGEEDRKGLPLNGIVGGMRSVSLSPDRQFDVIYQSGIRQGAEGYVLKNMTPTLREVVSRLQ